MGSSVILFLNDERLSKIKLPLNSSLKMGEKLA